MIVITLSVVAEHRRGGEATDGYRTGRCVVVKTAVMGVGGYRGDGR